MPDISQALAYLGLEAGASDKEVRRAYARALKLIDLDTDLQAFQSLREAYEIALGSRAGSGPVASAPAIEDEAQEAFEWIVAAVAVRSIEAPRWITDEPRPLPLGKGHCERGAYPLPVPFEHRLDHVHNVQWRLDQRRTPDPALPLNAAFQDFGVLRLSIVHGPPNRVAVVTVKQPVLFEQVNGIHEL